MDIISLNKVKKVDESVKDLKLDLDDLVLDFDTVKNDLAGVVEKAHGHTNEETLKKLELNAKNRLSYGTAEVLTNENIGEHTHVHMNSDVLGKLTEDSGGVLMYNGKLVGSTSIVNMVGYVTKGFEISEW